MQITMATSPLNRMRELYFAGFNFHGLPIKLDPVNISRYTCTIEIISTTLRNRRKSKHKTTETIKLENQPMITIWQFYDIID